MNYCNEVESFINYTSSNPRNISRGSIRCPFKRCKNKKFLDPDVVTMHLLQNRFMEKYLCWFAHGEPYVHYKTIVERMVRSTSSFSNVHGVADKIVILIGIWLWKRWEWSRVMQMNVQS